MLQTCQNCWFNGLQYGPLGLAVGYCVRHRRILNRGFQTTCGEHLRKDLALPRALEVAGWHAQRYPTDQIVSIHDGLTDPAAVSADSTDLDTLRSDEIADVVSDYGELDSTIESLAQLRQLPGARAEVAMLSLGRGYVKNCVQRQHGPWTSGLHLYWWTRRRLAAPPIIGMQDILWTGGLPLARQVELTGWSVIMLRLCLIDDIGRYAAEQHEPLVDDLLEQAADASQDFNIKRLTAWLKARALPQLDCVMPWERYQELVRQLHQDRCVVQSPTPARG